MTIDSAYTFVLVPGMAHGEWVWHPVARLLRERGHAVAALTLPGQSYHDSPVGVTMDDAIGYVAGEIERRDLRDVVLVAHSLAGYAVTGAAHRVPERIKEVVYYNAVVPERGVAMVGENEAYAAAIRELVASNPQGLVPFPFEMVTTGLLPDGSPQLQKLLYEMLVPTPAAYLLEAVEVDVVTKAGMRASYIASDDDRTLARPGREFAARLGVEPVVIPGGHLGLWTHPEVVAKELLRLIE